MSKLQSIRQKIIDQNYCISEHAELERVEDHLEIEDIENAILKGKLVEKQVDVRGTKYLIQGPTQDKRKITVVCTLKETSDLNIIAVFNATDK